MRLDQAVAALSDLSRNKAAELIRKSLVQVGGETITKPSHSVDENSTIEVLQNERYVSRAAYKLLGFLDESGIDPSGLNCLDVGSSTGGFTQVLLERGAASLTAVDVGRDQLHESLKNDPRLTLHEGVDIRDFVADRRFDLVVCDASFVALGHLIETIDQLAADRIVLLFKPQFEVGREVKRDKNGVVQDTHAIRAARGRFESACAGLGWQPLCQAPAALPGKSGNQEFFYGFKKCLTAAN